MSGIAGFFWRDGRPAEHDDLERMVGAIAHRGPDAITTWSGDEAALGHCMLQTVPEARFERLPLQDGDLVITADVRLDNREELMAALGWRDRDSGSITDGELLLAAYRHWGDRCPERLLGDFAFAIWDTRRRTLFAARSPFGLKPFFYFHSRTLSAFASEIKALLSLPSIPREIEAPRILDHIAGSTEDALHTCFRGILRLPPAHSLNAGPEGINLRCYWSLGPDRELRLRCDAEYAEAFREVFTEAVRCRLRSNYPVGAMLSGGLDSSSIVTMASRLQPGGEDGALHTYSLTFASLPSCDERKYIELVLKEAPLQAHRIPGDQTGPLSGLRHTLPLQDEPLLVCNLFLSTEVFRAARDHGVRVMLHGNDGDGVVSHGVAAIVEYARGLQWIEAYRCARGLSYVHGGSHWPFLWRRAVRPLVPARLRALWRQANGREQVRPAWLSLLNPEFASRPEVAEHLRQLAAPGPPEPETAREEHYRGLSRGIHAHAMEVADLHASAYGMEFRCPFYDRRLVEFCLSLPPRQKLSGGWSRRVLREAMAGLLPEEIRWRRDKADFEPAFVHGLRRFDGDRLNCLLVEEMPLWTEYLNQGVVQEVHQRFCSLGTPAEAYILWRAATLILWLRRLQQEYAPPPAKTAIVASGVRPWMDRLSGQGATTNEIG